MNGSLKEVEGPSSALRMYGPAVSIEHPLKVPTPDVVVSEQPESVACARTDRHRDRRVSVVTVLPPASSMVTTGWVPKALPATASSGSVVKTSWLAVPTVTSKAALSAGVRVSSEAVSW